MWDLPGPRLEPVSLALAGGFLTTVPPGKSLGDDFLNLTSKAKATKAKINKWDYVILKIFCEAKETISKMKRQPTE